MLQAFTQHSAILYCASHANLVELFLASINLVQQEQEWLGLWLPFNIRPFVLMVNFFVGVIWWLFFTLGNQKLVNIFYGDNYSL